MHDAWKGLKTLTGYSKPKWNSLNMPCEKQKERSDELHDFYCHFDTQDFRTELAQIRSELQGRWCMMLKILILRLMPRLLRAFFRCLTSGKQLVLTTSVEDFWNCAYELSVVFSQFFTWSLKENTEPFTWKTSIFCPVPKKTKSFLFKWLLSNCNEVFWIKMNVSSSTNS